MSSNLNDQQSLKEWLSNHSSYDDLRLLFFYIDGTMQYIHENDYAIDDFSPNEIFIVKNNIKSIRFHKLVELSKDEINRKNMIYDNVFSLSLLQIAAFFSSVDNDLDFDQIIRSLSSNNGSILKQNLDSYLKFVPESDIDYYEKVINNRESVYYNDYYYKIEENKLNSSNDNMSNQSTKQMIKKSNNTAGIGSIQSDIDISIYSKIDKDSAFINYFIIPTMIFVLGFVISFIIWLLSI